MGWLQTTWPASSSGWVWRLDRPKSSRPHLHTGQSVQTDQSLLCARVNTSCLLPLCRPSDHGPVALCKVLAPRVPKPISPVTSPPCSRARNNQRAQGLPGCWFLRLETRKGEDNLPSICKKGFTSTLSPKTPSPLLVRSSTNPVQ